MYELADCPHGPQSLYIRRDKCAYFGWLSPMPRIC